MSENLRLLEQAKANSRPKGHVNTNTQKSVFEVIDGADSNLLKSLKDQIAMREAQMEGNNHLEYSISTANSFEILRDDSDTDGDTSFTPANSLIDSQTNSFQDDQDCSEDQKNFYNSDKDEIT